MTMGLTPGQAKVLAVIKRWFATEYVAPSIREIMAETGLRSFGSVHTHLEALEQRGYIRRLKNRGRAIEMLDLARRWNLQAPAPAPGSVIVQVPLYTLWGLGALARAGLPVSALTWPVAA